LNFHAEEGDDGSLIGRDRVEVAHIPIGSPIRFLASNPGGIVGGREAAVVPSTSMTPDDLRRKEHALCVDHRDVAWVDVSCSGAAPRP